MKNLPPSRTENIVVRPVGDETLIYDLVKHKAYCLNATLTKVYVACDGETTFEDFKKRFHFTDDLIFLSLDELKKENLIKTDEEYQSPLANLTRREAAKRVGLATLIALPLITSLVAPTSLNAASPSPPPGPCANANGFCPFDNSFRQGTCCDGLRCLDTNTCAVCRAFGVLTYNFFSPTPSDCTPTACELDPRRNWCCSGNLDGFLTGFGNNVCDCRCAI